MLLQCEDDDVFSCSPKTEEKTAFKGKFRTNCFKLLQDVKNSEYDQEIPQSEITDNPWHREEEPPNHHETPGRQIKQSNQ